jgi:Putative transposase/Transposase zinc-binding domain
MKTAFEVSRIISRFKDAYLKEHPYHPQVMKVLGRLEQCRTSALGGHVDACPECGHVRVSYNSCRDRHCPKCQGMERELWIQARKEDLLPVKYFHVVFTLPDAINSLLLGNMKQGYTCLFGAAWKTIDAFAGKQGVQPGMIALLHTWGSSLQYHPHLHCIVPAGGVDKQGKWKEFPNARNRSPFLFPVKAMSKMFRAKFVSMFSAYGITIPQQMRKELFRQDWVVFCKFPFKGREMVLEYIGRYSHRVAISNSRIKQVDQEFVTFDYKDYKDGAKHKLMKITGVEFLRRFSMHILPNRFVRIRHYGFLASCNREKLREVQRQLNHPLSPLKRKRKKWMEIYQEKELGYNLCPSCKQAQLVTVQTLNPIRPPPQARCNSGMPTERSTE